MVSISSSSPSLLSSPKTRLRTASTRGSRVPSYSGGQRQQIIIPGYGASSGTYTGYLDYVLTQKLCIGPPTGKLSKEEAVAVKSDTCNTEYTVKYL